MNRIAIKHDLFDCWCDGCMRAYFAWCDSRVTFSYDLAKWERYDNHAIKDAAQTRGYVTNGDLLACGHSVNQLRALAIGLPCSDCGMTRCSLMFREYEAGTEWGGNACCEVAA